MAVSIHKLNTDELSDQLIQVPGWTINDAGELHREFKFKDFAEAFAFMTRVAMAAEQMNHHPDWTNIYNRVSVKLTTHDAGGITLQDFELARQMNRLADG